MNPFKALAQIIKKQVKEEDKKGFAKNYKECFDLFKEHIKNSGFTITEEYFYDSYFIFGKGTNSIVHFYIQEIPGWKFAIWWNEPKTLDEFTGEFFTQYEDNIDKFKPTRSEIRDTITILNINKSTDIKEPKYECCAYEVISILDFMKKNPELAFCRDYCGWNYNFEYHTKEEAVKEYEKYKQWYNHKKEVTKEYTEEMIKLFYKMFDELIKKDEVFLYFEDEYASPQYMIVVLRQGVLQQITSRPGCYALKDLFDIDLKEYNEIKNKYEAIAENGEFWLPTIYDEFALLANEEHYNKLKESNKNKCKEAKNG